MVKTGIVLWAVAFVALLPFWSVLENGGRLWWLPMCAFGFGLGFVGLRMMRKRDAAIARAEQDPSRSPSS